MKNKLENCSKVGKLLLVFLITFSQMNFPLSVLAEELTENIINEEAIDTTKDENPETYEDESENEYLEDTSEEVPEEEQPVVEEQQEEEKETPEQNETDVLEEEPVIETPSEDTTETEEEVVEENTLVYVNGNLVNDFTYVLSDGELKAVITTSKNGEEQIEFRTINFEKKIYGEYNVTIDENTNLLIIYNGDNAEIINSKYIFENSDVIYRNGMYMIRGNNETISKDKFLSNFSEKLSEEYEAKLSTTCEYITSECKLVIEDTNEFDVEDEFEIIVKGDLNNDGIVDVNDQDEFIYSGVLFNQSNLTLKDFERYDINTDGVIDILDASASIFENGEWSTPIEAHDSLQSTIDAYDEVTVGDTFTVTYSVFGFDKDTLKAMSANINYNHDLLRVTSISYHNSYKSGYCDEEKCILTFDDYNGDGALISVTFEALEVGNAGVSFDEVMLSNGVLLSLENDMPKMITIINNAKGGDVSEDDTASNETKNESTSEVSNNVVNTGNYYQQSRIQNIEKRLSDDNYIKELTIKGYSINFDMYTYEYAIKVKNSVKSLDINVLLNSEYASYEIQGNENFKVGDNEVIIKVTAEDGTQRDYKVKVTRAKADTKEKDEEEETSKSSKTIIIILIILVIIGLIYVIFKDDEEDKNA